MKWALYPGAGVALEGGGRSLCTPIPLARRIFDPERNTRTKRVRKSPSLCSERAQPPAKYNVNITYIYIKVYDRERGAELLFQPRLTASEAHDDNKARN